MRDRALWIAVGVGTLLSLAVAYGLATHSLVVGSLLGGWHYGYSEVSDARWPAYAAIAILVACSLAIFVRQGDGAREWIPILGWLCAASGLQWLLQSLAPFSLDSIFQSHDANSYYLVTTRVDARTLLARFLELRPTFPAHAHSNMPGKFLFLYGLELLSTDPSVLARLVVVVSNLGGVLLYLFVRDLFSDRKVAFYALILYLLVPARLFFFPLLNTVTPVPLFACLWLLLRTLQTRSGVCAALLGIAVFGLGFFEPVPFVAGTLGVALAARSIWIGEIETRRAVVLGLIAAAASVASYALIYAATGFDWIAAFRDLYLDAMQFHAASDRPYWIWLIANPREFFFGVGTCQVVLFFAAIGYALWVPGDWRARLVQPVAVFSLGWLASFAALDLSGVSRGEVIRIWIFLACLMQVPAAFVCARLQHPAAIALVVATTVLHAALGTASVRFLVTAPW